MNLFDIPETKSPRLLWMERHHMQRVANGDTIEDALFVAAKYINIKLRNEQ